MKRTTRKLGLSKESVRKLSTGPLSANQMRQVAGGYARPRQHPVLQRQRGFVSDGVRADLGGRHVFVRQRLRVGLRGVHDISAACG